MPPDGPNPAALRAALEHAGFAHTPDLPLAKLGFWRIGGPADAVVEVRTTERLQALARLGLPTVVVGKGSNLLVADQGIRGVVVRLRGALARACIEPGPQGDPVLLAGGGAANVAVLSRLDRAGLCGLGALVGVPGTIGGAIRMNAGTALGEIGDRVAWVELVLRDGQLVRLAGTDLDFRYRWAALPPGSIVARTALRVGAAGLEASRTAARHHLARRRMTQPLDQPSCGSVFKNPPGDHAGRLIEAVGLKGHVHGGAAISPLHANFIVNQGGARAADVRELIMLARARVWHQHGVLLEPEVHAIGAWPQHHWPPGHPG